MYHWNSLLICLILLTVILAAEEAGYRVGRRQRRRSDSGSKTQTNAIQGAILGLLGLLLGFTFTMALQRYDSRSAAVIQEANAIGTAVLRTELLPEERSRREARRLLADYVDSRLHEVEIDLTRTALRQESRQSAQQLQEALWTVALEASLLDPHPTTAGLFIQSLNALIDVYGEREAALEKHVPEVVLWFLFMVLVIAEGILGYAAGLAGARPLVASVAMSLLIVLVIFIIIDLDRPRRGLIRVSQASMQELAASLDDPAAEK